VKRRIFDLTVVCLILFMFGCNKDSEDRIEVLIVSSKLVPNGTIPSSDVMVDVMELTKENSNDKYYIALGKIEGFEYTEGYEYKLKVRISPIDNPPMDGYTESYKLIEVIYMIKRE
jgi:hypothetical protein